MKYAINGKFLSQQTTGVQRFARELIYELDKIVEVDKICLIVAENIKENIKLNHIKIISIGNKIDFYWLQILFPLYCKKNKLISINLCGAGPLILPGIVCMHDVGFIHNPNFVSKKFYWWGKLQIWNSIHRAKGLLTVSEFSKKDLENLYPITKGKFRIIPNAWQHMLSIKADTTIFQKYPKIKGDYYFSMSSLSPNKNLQWIINTAKLNTTDLFVIAGKINKKVFGKKSIQTPKNVLYIGYVSDPEAKALMENCKAFVFPTFFEGFGIPPLEALSCGTNIIVSDIECMHEIYENTAHYINPRYPAENLNKILNTPVAPNNDVLRKYSWKKSAKILKDFLNI